MKRTLTALILLIASTAQADIIALGLWMNLDGDIYSRSVNGITIYAGWTDPDTFAIGISGQTEPGNTWVEIQRIGDIFYLDPPEIPLKSGLVFGCASEQWREWAIPWLPEYSETPPILLMFFWGECE